MLGRLWVMVPSPFRALTDVDASLHSEAWRIHDIVAKSIHDYFKAHTIPKTAPPRCDIPSPKAAETPVINRAFTASAAF